MATGRDRWIERSLPSLGALGMVGALLLVSASAAAATCPARGTVVLVSTGEHRLLLCDGGREAKAFKVALGSGGTGKRVAGDKKTPIGTYALVAARPSKQFGTFIPIAYPTADQRARGFTGADVGVHGPKRWFRWAGSANVAFDWTLGCIAVATDAEIEEIAKWLHEKHVSSITVE